MRKFRKKFIIEAEQFFSTLKEKPEGVLLGPDGYYVGTLEGDHKLREGDWVIKGQMGEFYNCRDDIFIATYEEVDVD